MKNPILRHINKNNFYDFSYKKSEKFFPKKSLDRGYFGLDGHQDLYHLLEVIDSAGPGSSYSMLETLEGHDDEMVFFDLILSKMPYFLRIDHKKLALLNENKSPLDVDSCRGIVINDFVDNNVFDFLKSFLSEMEYIDISFDHFCITPPCERIRPRTLVLRSNVELLQQMDLGNRIEHLYISLSSFEDGEIYKPFKRLLRKNKNIKSLVIDHKIDITKLYHMSFLNELQKLSIRPQLLNDEFIDRINGSQVKHLKIKGGNNGCSSDLYLDPHLVSFELFGVRRADRLLRRFCSEQLENLSLRSLEFDNYLDIFPSNLNFLQISDMSASTMKGLIQCTRNCYINGISVNSRFLSDEIYTFMTESQASYESVSLNPQHEILKSTKSLCRLIRSSSKYLSLSNFIISTTRPQVEEFLNSIKESNLKYLSLQNFRFLNKNNHSYFLREITSNLPGSLFQFNFFGQNTDELILNEKNNFMTIGGQCKFDMDMDEFLHIDNSYEADKLAGIFGLIDINFTKLSHRERIWIDYMMREYQTTLS